MIALDSPAARSVNELPPAQSHRYRLMAQKPWRSFPGGTLHLASAREFPMSTTMTGLIIRLQPGAMQELHWHPNANEWFYVSKGRVRATLFGADKRMAVAELARGTADISRRAGGIRWKRGAASHARSCRRSTTAFTSTARCRSGSPRCRATCCATT